MVCKRNSYHVPRRDVGEGTRQSYSVMGSRNTEFSNGTEIACSDLVNQGSTLVNQDSDLVNQGITLVNQDSGLLNQSSDLINQSSDLVNQGSGLGLLNQGTSSILQLMASHNLQLLFLETVSLI